MKDFHTSALSLLPLHQMNQTEWYLPAFFPLENFQVMTFPTLLRAEKEGTDLACPIPMGQPRFRKKRLTGRALRAVFQHYHTWLV
jgi:hypothetical protein